MRPVNLIPESERPARATGGYAGSAYVVLGVLAALVVMVGMYVVSSNRTNSKKEQTIEAKNDAAKAEAQVAALGAFGDFAQIAETRTESVRALARGRFDWERFIRELAHVLPAGTWLTDVDAAVAGTEGSDESSGEGGTLRAQSNGPRATLKGCARRQTDVAKLMVRLRRMHRVEDVGLTESTRSQDGGSASGASSSGSDCGPFYAFDLTVAFAGTEPESSTEGKGESVPAELGGGS